MNTTQADSCPVYLDGASLCRICDADFVRRVVSDIQQEAPDVVGRAMVVSGYTPPFEGPAPQGFVVVTLYRDADESAVFGIFFGAEPNPDGSPYRAGFDAEYWRQDKTNPLGAGIYTANWDEAWMLVCAIGRHAAVVDVQLSYGA